MADRIAHREGPAPDGRPLRMPRSTVYAVLCRRGLGRLRELDRPTGVPIRSERDCPGEVEHFDIKELTKVPNGGGGKTHGRGQAGRTQEVAQEYVYSIDHHSHFAYSEIHNNQRSETCDGSILRAAEAFATLGYRIDRVMADDTWSYRRVWVFADALTQIGAYELTRPNRPLTNSKVEQTTKPSPTDGPTGSSRPATGPDNKLSPTSSTTTDTTDSRRPIRPTTHHPSCQPPLWEGQLVANLMEASQPPRDEFSRTPFV